MKHFLIIIIFFLLPKLGFSQFESKKNPVKFSAKLPASTTQPQAESPKFLFPTKPQYSNNFPDINKKNPNSGGLSSKNNFISANDIFKDRLEQQRGSILGSFFTDSKYVKIVARDFGDFDGDKVDVYLNDVIVKTDVLLTNDEKHIILNLVKGVNKIQFKAINEGSQSPNTAEFTAYDDRGGVITTNQWTLLTNEFATFFVNK